MIGIVGYLYLIALTIILGGIFAVIMLCDYRWIKRQADREIKKLEILGQLILLKNNVETDSAKYMKESSPEFAYLSQIDFVLNNNPFQIDKRMILPFNLKKRNNSGIDPQALHKSYERAPACVKKNINRLSELFGMIYEMQHPIKYKFFQLKKNIHLQILKILLNLCSALIKILEKRCEAKNKKKIAMLKTQKKNVQKSTSSVLLKARCEYNNELLEAV